MSNILAINSFMFQPYIMLPVALDEFLPFQFSTIPLFGKFLNIITLGLDPQFAIQQVTEGLFQKINFFANKQMIDFISTDFPKMNNQNLLPLNMFSIDNPNEIGSLLGSKVDTMALTAKLTDRVKCA